MSKEPFGRQLKPVKIRITGGEDIDRSYWCNRIQSMLSNQASCAVHTQAPSAGEHSFDLYPDANNE